MSIESEVFKRREFDSSRLLSFGFHLENGALVYRSDFTDGFYAVLSCVSGEMRGNVFDADTNEEYTVFRLEGVSGAFIIGVRNAYISLLESIRDACSTAKLYLTEQSARITSAIFDRYGASPEFLWKRFPHYCVFRNDATRKWFAILMDLDRSKVVPGESGVTDIMNVKLDERTDDYMRKGAYSCFHMNDKHWVSIILDDRISDDLVLEMIEVSYHLSFGKNKKKASSV